VPGPVVKRRIYKMGKQGFRKVVCNFRIETIFRIGVPPCAKHDEAGTGSMRNPLESLDMITIMMTRFILEKLSGNCETLLNTLQIDFWP